MHVPSVMSSLETLELHYFGFEITSLVQLRHRVAWVQMVRLHEAIQNLE